MSIVSAIAVPHPPLIVPAVGRGQEKRICATIDAYEKAAQLIVGSKPDCLVVTSPHAPMFRDGFHVTTDTQLIGSMVRFNAPQENMTASCDVELAETVVRSANEAGIPAVGSNRYRDDMDHGTYVPLYFVRKACEETGMNIDVKLPFPIVRIGLSGLSPETHRALGRIIAEAAETLGRRVAFVASGDLSHKLLADGPYGFAPEGPVFDERIGEIFKSGNLEGLFEFDEEFCEAAAECGLRSFQIMAGALEGTDCNVKLLSNEGPFGVGYAVAMITPEDTSSEGFADNEPATYAASPTDDVDPCIALARLSVETYVKTGRPAKLPDDVPAELLTQRAGAFVSLHEHGELRGCIGTIAATKPNVAEEILANGISACSRDPRFDPVRPDELDYLEYSVDVLGDAEPISSPAELDVKRYGVIVTKGWKRGLLLPNLDGVDTIDYQVEIAKRKAGISPYDDDVDLERFEVVRHTRGGRPRK
ncbi:MAG: AmmeMemoRadiSam system protein A [Eggerthellaceae bacterium]|nr:AmmeMemoRadiSam system protein A [Eggerthellaceae bacterium]